MARLLAVGLGSALLGALLSGCTLLRPLDGLTCEPGAGNASCRYGQSCDSDADCATTACSGGACQCPEDMVAIDSRYCIDEVEVSNLRYREFLAKEPRVEDQEPLCRWNSSFDFDEINGPDVCRARLKEDGFPATCIDWCDASAYCRSLGKRLCGAIGGGAIEDSAHDDPARDEWYRACSKDGERTFPTEEYDPSSCNGDGDRPVEVRVVGEERCEGGYNGLQHMSGNVREWEGSCTGDVGAADFCLARGGAFDSGGTLSELQCDDHDPRERSDTDHTIGIRCCSG